MVVAFAQKGIKGFQKGHVVPAHIREKIAAINTGKKASLETRQKMSLTHKGLTHIVSAACREAARQRILGTKQSPELIAKRFASRKGYRHSLETRLKMSASQRNLKQVKKTNESKVWRKRIEYKIWRNNVFKRDNHTCRKCGIRGGYLHPHHIRNFAEVVSLRFRVDNGITLCLKHHRDFHKLYGKTNNSLEQINKYLV